MGSDVSFCSYPDSWYFMTLGELLDMDGGKVQTGPFGSQLHASDYVSEGIPSVMPKNISIEGIVEEGIARITETDANRLSKYLLEEGDIVYSRRGDVEKCALVKEHEAGWLCGTGCLRVRLEKNGRITAEYLHAYLSSPEIREWISRNAIGATMPNLNTSILRDVPILIPEKKDVIFTADFWMRLNNKIQLNRQTNQTLEAMAQALFKSWFVDFDPVFDNIIAHNLAHNNEPLHNIPEPLLPHAQRRLNVHNVGRGSARQTASHAFHHLFPQAFEQSDEPSVGIQGWVPKGWRVKTLADITTELRRGISPKYAEKTGIRVINQKCIRHHEVNYSLCRLNDPALRKIEGRELEIGDVLVNSTGVGTLGRVAPVKFLDEATVVDSHVTVVRSNPEIYPTFVFAQLMIAKEWEIEALGEGSTGQTELSRKILSEQTVLCPNVKLLNAVDNIFEGLADKSVSNSRQLKELESLRDTLLPKLISGELRIPEAVQASEALAK